jgi:hypothetical protein
VRIPLQIVVVLSGLLLAREFMLQSNEHFRLVLRWARVASENITTVYEEPQPVAPVAVGPIAEVSVQSISIVHETPALVAAVVTPIAEVSTQSIATVHDEPPVLLAPRPVAQIAQVSAQSIATVRRSPSLIATDVAEIAVVSPKSIGTGDHRPAPVATVEVAPIAALSAPSIGAVQDRSAVAPSMEVAQIGGEAALSLTLLLERNEHLAASAQIGQVSSIATVRDEPPGQLAPMAVAPEVSTQSIAVIEEVPTPVAQVTACEQIWDQMTHMTRDEWAEACHRVDELRLVGRN